MQIRNWAVDLGPPNQTPCKPKMTFFSRELTPAWSPPPPVQLTQTPRALVKTSASDVAPVARLAGVLQFMARAGPLLGCHRQSVVPLAMGGCWGPPSHHPVPSDSSKHNKTRVLRLEIPLERVSCSTPACLA